ncbi:MAG: hypothetical protein WA418_37175 [Bradyrhizobium sp.]
MARTPARGKKGGGSDMQLSFKLDKEKVEAIQRCLKKGKLTIKLSSIDAIKGGRANSVYIYD